MVNLYVPWTRLINIHVVILNEVLGQVTPTCVTADVQEIHLSHEEEIVQV